MKTPQIFRTTTVAIVVILMGWLQAGCRTTADLEPAAGANQVAGLEEAARSTVAGVRMLTQADEWPGSHPIKNEVTPMRVRIENSSGMPLALRYREFTLVGPQGERYSALPPFRISGTVEEPVMATTYAPITNPAFTYTGFEVAPFYSPIYPGITPFADPFLFDPLYYDNTFTYWRDIALPTDEMLEQALPEGVIRSGGSVEGWVYFEDVPEDVNSVVFRFDLVNALTGNEFGEIRIPYNVK